MKMTMLKKFSIVGVALLISMSVAFAIIIAGASSIGSNSDVLANRALPVLQKAHELKLSVVQVQQWLTDISATRGLDGLNDGFDEAEANAQRFRTLLNELQQLDPEHRERYQAMLPVFDAYYETGKRMAQGYVEQGPSRGNQLMGEFDGVAAAMAEQVDGFLADAKQQAGQMIADQSQLAGHALKVVVVCFLVLVAILAGAAYMLWRSIRHIPNLLTELERVAGGDLTERTTQLVCHDEVGALCKGLNQMKEKLRDTMLGVAEASGEVSSAAERVSEATDQTREVLAVQQRDFEQLVAAMTELGASSQEVSSHAQLAAESAQGADREAAEGKRVVAETVKAIDQLAAEVAAASEVIERLERDSSEIGGILDVIRGIAEQTNLLALNAAIEAARAGEQGRGFAVVADEVRTLASRTQQSTQEIQEMIERLQSGAHDAVNVMARGRERADASVSQAGEAGARLDTITQAVFAISDMVSHIADASSQQSGVVQEMEQNFSNINNVASHSAETAEQNAETSRYLAEMATRLQGTVGQFQL